MKHGLLLQIYNVKVKYVLLSVSLLLLCVFQITYRFLMYFIQVNI